MNERGMQFLVACALIVCAFLLYLDWWRQGELEQLNLRVNEIERARAKRASRAKTPTTPKQGEGT